MSPLETPTAAAMARHLPALLARLRAARYGVGPDEAVAIHRLLARSASEKRWPLAPPALARVLAPVVCRSAAEQQRFGDHFASWLAEVPARSQRGAEAKRHTRRPAPAPKPAKPKAAARFRVRGWRLAAVLLVVVVLALVARWWVLMQFIPAEIAPTPPHRTFAGRTEPAGVRILIGGSERELWPIVFAVSLWLAPFYCAWLYGGLLPAWLTRRSAPGLPELDRLSFGQPIHPLGGTWRGIQGLCDRDLRRDPGLQVEATVRATVEKGGYFTPVYRHRPALPEYLALVDRLSPEDHLARFAEALMTRLEERGLATRTVFFSRDPRRGVGALGRAVSPLGTLSGHTHAERLLIFSDARLWFDAQRGRLRPGLEALGRWRQRFVLTPLPRSEWGRREQALAADRLTPFPLGEQGVESLAEHFTTGEALPALAEATSGEAAPTGGYPRLLGHRPKRWLDDVPPESAEVHELLASLAKYLGGAGSRWLRACAVFPAVSWPVTCHLGQHLRDDSGLPLFTEERLLQLARLPWFRYGKMPDWLRLELIDGLSRNQRELVDEGLRRLLTESVRATGASGEPEVAQQPAELSEGGGLGRWLARQPRQSVLRDYLFLTFMRGRRPLRLALAAPRRLRALIRDVDRWSVLASALLAVVGTAMVAAWYRLGDASVVPGPALRDGIRSIPMPAVARLPEASIVTVGLLLAMLVIGRFGAKRGDLAAAAGEASVPSLVARIAARRSPILIPWVATSWVCAFMAADIIGSPPGWRWIAAHLLALLTLGGYFYLEQGFSSVYRARLDALEGQLDAGAAAEIGHELVAFLHGRAPAREKRRLLRRVDARLREPPADVVRQLFELQHSSALGPRTKSLLARVVRHLEERSRQQLDGGDSP